MGKKKTEYYQWRKKELLGKKSLHKNDKLKKEIEKGILDKDVVHM